MLGPTRLQRLCALALARAALSCALEADAPPPCVLNGALNVTTGACVCLPGWTGPSCGELRLKPAPRLDAAEQLFFHPWDENSWGFSVLPADGDGLFHAFITEMANNCSVLVYPYVSCRLGVAAGAIQRGRRRT